MQKCPKCGGVLDGDLHFCPALNDDPARVQLPPAPPPSPSPPRFKEPPLWSSLGRIGPGRYFVWSFILWFIFFVCVDRSSVHPIVLLPGLALFRGLYCLNVKRLRALGWPMWLRWLTFVPFANLLLMAAMVLL
jgi:hypothetical protein